MTEQNTASEVANDLGYLRALAEEGRNAPLLGGRFAVMWGVLVAIALLAQWLILSGLAGLKPQALGVVWITMMVVGALGSVVLGRSLRNKPGIGSFGNRAESAVWSAGGFAIFVYWLAITAGVVIGKGGAGLFDSIMIAAFAIYGVCYFTSGNLSGNHTLRVIGALCFLAAIIMGALIHQPISYLVAAIFVVLVTVVPGFMQLRAEPSELV
ncbi:hypothetical protein MNBD_ALPHA06-1393 [hydrothermal vent metagenome]|uniref:Uncharacterized protein n=1 Tax=hydrothermal vent metagenome TaxID=652676 RepID=A0A3B0R6V8_9ZZZZ